MKTAVLNNTEVFWRMQKYGEQGETCAAEDNFLCPYDKHDPY